MRGGTGRNGHALQSRTLHKLGKQKSEKSASSARIEITQTAQRPQRKCMAGAPERAPRTILPALASIGKNATMT
jgi:hypothetical protein